MKLYHITKKSNLESIMKRGLLTSFHLRESKYTDITSGPAVYLSKFLHGNNLSINLSGEELVSLEINLEDLDKTKIRPDDSIYWAFNNEMILTELEEIQEAFGLTMEEAKLKLEELEALMDKDLVEAFKNLGLWFLEKEGEIAYLEDISFSLVQEIHFI